MEKKGASEPWHSSVASLCIAPRLTPTYIFIFNLENEVNTHINRSTASIFILYVA